MRVSRFALLVVATAALTGGALLAQAQPQPPGPSPQPMPGPPKQPQPQPNPQPNPGSNAGTFTFAVCNKDKQTASVALAAHPAVGDNGFVVAGWWNVNAGQCATIGSFPQGWFYYYAAATDGDWRGSGEGAVDVCVSEQAFTRVNTDNYTCGANEVLVTFNGRLIQQSGTFTWTLNP